MAGSDKPRWLEPAEVVLLRPGQPSPESALERAERVLGERLRGECVDGYHYFHDLEHFGEQLCFDFGGNLVSEPKPK